MANPTVTIRYLDRNPISSRSTEFVERKGIRHPDSICDGIAEAVSRHLSRRYLDEFGRTLHHNTDSVQLVAGTTDPAFGGGTVGEPRYVLLGGRATKTVDGRRIPVDDIAVEAAEDYVDARFREVSRDDVEFESRRDVRGVTVVVRRGRGSTSERHQRRRRLRSAVGDRANRPRDRIGATRSDSGGRRGREGDGVALRGRPPTHRRGRRRLAARRRHRRVRDGGRVNW